MSLSAPPESSQKSGLLKKYDISVEHLSYEYLDKCTNAGEIEKIVIVLRSGEEGCYPNLLEYAEKKLEQIQPQNRILWVPQSIIKTNKMKHQEELELKSDINNWLQQIHSIEKDLDHMNRVDSITSMAHPDVRSTKQVKMSQENKKKSKICCIKSCDYNSWDKYDADVELNKMDLEEERHRLEIKENLKQKDNTLITPVNLDLDLTSSLSGIELNKTAEQEKRKGNEAFKAGDYQEALHFYNSCLQMKTTIDGYNNRAITFIKLEKYKEALEDCNVVLEIESTNIKGLLRRALTLEKLGNEDQAIIDYTNLLKLQPTNSIAMSALKRLSMDEDQ